MVLSFLLVLCSSVSFFVPLWIPLFSLFNFLEDGIFDRSLVRLCLTADLTPACWLDSLPTG